MSVTYKDLLQAVEAPKSELEFLEAGLNNGCRFKNLKELVLWSTAWNGRPKEYWIDLMSEVCKYENDSNPLANGWNYD